MRAQFRHVDKQDIVDMYIYIHACALNRKNVTEHAHARFLLLSGHVEHNPGPYTPKFPCMLCSKAVKWGQRALACDSCDKWCHVSCMAMSTADYDQLANSSVTWICSSCNTPNFTKLYDSILVDNNSFECLSSASMDSIALSSPTSSTMGSPSATSSPKKSRAPNSQRSRRELRTIVLNFQRIKNKVPETQVLIDSADPDVILGSETWLNSNVFSSEVLPTNYNVFRRDRADGYGGVLIAVKDDLVSTPVHTSSDSELISVKIKCNRSKSVIVTSF